MTRQEIVVECWRFKERIDPSRPPSMAAVLRLARQCGAAFRNEEASLWLSGFAKRKRRKPSTAGSVQGSPREHENSSPGAAYARAAKVLPSSKEASPTEDNANALSSVRESSDSCTQGERGAVETPTLPGIEPVKPPPVRKTRPPNPTWDFAAWFYDRALLGARIHPEPDAAKEHREGEVTADCKAAKFLCRTYGDDRVRVRGEAMLQLIAHGRKNVTATLRSLKKCWDNTDIDRALRDHDADAEDRGGGYGPEPEQLPDALALIREMREREADPAPARELAHVG